MITFLSSWSPKIYEVSGKFLVNSYTAYGPPSIDSRFISYDDNQIENWRHYQKWHNANVEIIPEHFGGTAKPCTCPRPFSRQDHHHKIGCTYNWWNRNASRWCRKIFALEMCVTEYRDSDFFIWLDADCVFQKAVSVEIIETWFNKTDIFYFKGPYRKFEETGIVGYRNTTAVQTFIKEYLYTYTSGLFRHLRRWDDCYIFQKLRLRSKDIIFRDLGNTVTGVGDVIPSSIVGPYISHDKGRHGRKLGLIQ